ncbi:MAG: LytTR family transcriptional regulator [Rudanella sp.]|nr:LytTR family transcriptional regulator [Rudanella sp.]
MTDYRTLDELDELVDPSRFFRANRQFVISSDVVVSYLPQFTGKLAVRLLTPFETVEVLISKEKAPAFRQWLEG